MTLGEGWRGGSVYVFAIYVDCVTHEGRASMTALGVALLEAEELDFLRDKIDDVDHFGNWNAIGFWWELENCAKLRARKIDCVRQLCIWYPRLRAVCSGLW